MSLSPNDSLDEQMERYFSQKLATRLKLHIDIQTIQSARKAKSRRLLIVTLIAALMALLLILPQIFWTY